MVEAILKSERIFEGRIFAVRRDTVRSRQRGTQIREVVEHPGAVAIVPLANKNEIIMVEQYRHAIGQSLLEIPAGTLESGESPITCAKRELLEETGFVASKFTPLLRCYLAPGYSSEIVTIYAAMNLRYKSSAPASDERIKVTRLKLRKIISMMKRNQIRDAKTICGIFALASLAREI